MRRQRLIEGHLLIAAVTSLNFFMLGIQDSSLFALLPKLLGGEHNSTTKSNASRSDLEYAPFWVVSWVLLAKSATMLLLSPVVAWWVSAQLGDKASEVRAALAGCVCGAVVLAVYSLGGAGSVAVLVLGRIIDAGSASLVFVATLALVARLYTDSEARARLIGLANIVFYISLSVGPLCGVALEAACGPDLFWLLLVPGWMLCAGLLVLLALKTRPKENTLVAEPNTPQQVGSNFLALLRDPYMMFCVLDILIVDLGQYALPGTLPTWMKYGRMNSTDEQLGMVWLFLFVGYCTGVGVVIATGAWFGSEKVKVVVAVVAKLILAALMWWLPSITDWRLLLVPMLGIFACIGATEQVIFPLANLLADRSHNADYARTNCLMSQSLNLSAVLACLAAGPIASSHWGFPLLCRIMGTAAFLTIPFTALHLRHL